MNKTRKILYISLLFLFLFTFLFSGWKLLTYTLESAETQSGYDALSQLRQEATVPPTTAPTVPPSTEGTAPPESEAPTEETKDPNEGLIPMTHPTTEETVWMRPEFCDLFSVNPDIVGWITLEDTRIDYPVVHRPQDRDYYLKRDFYGKKASRGCIYAREECDVLAPSDNVVLYGHMMNDYTMFGDLSRYTKKTFWESHRYIRFDTLREPGLYEILCVFKTSASGDQQFPYHQYTEFETEEQFTAFWQECTARQLYETGLTPHPTDKLLTLSTCEYTLENGRLVIVAKRIEN